MSFCSSQGSRDEVRLVIPVNLCASSRIGQDKVKHLVVIYISLWQSFCKQCSWPGATKHLPHPSEY